MHKEIVIYLAQLLNDKYFSDVYTAFVLLWYLSAAKHK